MKVRCIGVSGNLLSIRAGYPDDYQCESLEIGKILNVYSIGHWDNYMYYLLKVSHPDPDLDLDPVWFPYEWFEVVDHKIPDSWYFNFVGEPQSEQITTIFGYKEIVLNYEHHYGLMERDQKHLKLFYNLNSLSENE